MVAPCCPDAVIVNASLLLLCTKMPHVKHCAIVSAYDTETVGANDCGTVSVMVVDDVPTTVFPLYVVQVSVQVPVDALGISAASVVEGVQDTLPALVFVAIVPVVEPNL